MLSHQSGIEETTIIHYGEHSTEEELSAALMLLECMTDWDYRFVVIFIDNVGNIDSIKLNLQISVYDSFTNPQTRIPNLIQMLD